MNTYLMGVYRYWRGYENFEIEAEDAIDAVAKAFEYTKNEPHFNDGNYNVRSIKVVKKLQK